MILLISSTTALADPPKTMMNTIYAQAMIGSSVMAEVTNTPSTVSDQESEASTAITGAIGYRWKYFGLELLAASLGETTVNHSDFYTETHKATFIGGGLHWAWWFFDLKFGWGNLTDKTKFEKGDKSASFSANPNNKSTGQTAGYFGIGLNFDLGENTELVIDYTAYAYTKKKPQVLVLDGVTHESSDPEYGIGTINLGLRWFL